MGGSMEYRIQKHDPQQVEIRLSYPLARDRSRTEEVALQVVQHSRLRFHDCAGTGPRNSRCGWECISGSVWWRSGTWPLQRPCGWTRCWAV